MSRYIRHATCVLVLLLAAVPGWSQPRDPGRERESPSPPERPEPAAPVEIVALLLPRQPGADAIARDLNLVLVVQYQLFLLNARLVVYRLQPRDQVGDALARLAQRQILADENGAFLQPQQDPLAARQYSLEKAGALRAHAVLRGRGITVAIVDAGIDMGHEDLRDSIAAQETMIEGQGAVGPDAHGTAVAGVIAARDTGIGIVGVAPAARIVALQACVPRRGGVIDATCTAHRVARAIDASARHRVQIVNISLGGRSNRVVSRLIDATIVQGIAVVAAGGNNGPSGPPLHPGALPGVLGLGATDSRDLLYERSNMGVHVAVFAPGVDVLTTAPQHRYRFVTGTSFAAAAVSGSLALLLEAAPGQPASRLVAALAEGTVKDPGGRIGRIDLCRSLALLGLVDGCR